MRKVPVDNLVRELCTDANHAAACSRAIEAYKAEIVHFLKYRLRNDADVHDVFSMFCEDVWQGVSKFNWQCTLRCWLYTVARHAACRYVIAQRRTWPIASSESADLLAAPGPRTSTQRYLQSSIKERFRDLRRRLPEDDQLLLRLRVDREWSWVKIARTMLGPTTASEDAVTRETARLRKRFQLIKARMRAWAIEEGLLDEHPEL